MQCESASPRLKRLTKVSDPVVSSSSSTFLGQEQSRVRGLTIYKCATSDGSRQVRYPTVRISGSNNDYRDRQLAWQSSVTGFRRTVYLGLKIRIIGSSTSASIDISISDWRVVALRLLFIRESYILSTTGF